MQSNANTRPEQQLQNRIRRITEGVLMLGGALIGLWLLAAVAIFLFR
jgi:hypothetical protein